MTRKKFSPSVKVAVAVAASSGALTLNEVASKYDVHPTQVKKWRDQLKTEAVGLFTDKRSAGSGQRGMQQQIDELHRVIGKRDAELEWLKKKTPDFGV
ncbi:MAG: transposase [Mycobacteriales bacterium]